MHRGRFVNFCDFWDFVFISCCWGFVESHSLVKMTQLCNLYVFLLNQLGRFKEVWLKYVVDCMLIACF